MIDITGLREDKRPQSSAIVHALLDRLEAAEKERDQFKSDWLEREGIPFVVAADGKPRVLQAVIMGRLGGQVVPPNPEPRLRLRHA